MLNRLARVAVLFLLLPLGGALAATGAPELADFWAGDKPNDGGAVIAVRWRNAHEDPPSRFWRVFVKQVGLPDGKGGMVPVDGPVNWPKPADPLTTDYKATQNWLKDVKAPFWCWPPVPDGKKDTHWITVDLGLHFKPKAEDEALKAKGAELSQANEALKKSAEGPERDRMRDRMKALERERRQCQIAFDDAVDRVRRGRYEVQLAYQDQGMGALQRLGTPVAVSARADWWDAAKTNNLVFAVLLCGVILTYIARARKQRLFLRRIPGIDAIEEAIGRGTEMGRPIYYFTGRHGITDLSTMAAATILGEVAKKVATYDTQLKVPHTNAIVMSVCQEITREAYLEAGRPDAFQEDANFYVTDDQFSYVAAVDGMMVRERPAACFFMGYYYAEALLLAETGSATGAIQIAGTDSESQLPFFVTACDYTLIGEELFAASAYLSKDPMRIGTLRGQDVGKLLLMGFLLLGTAVATSVKLLTLYTVSPAAQNASKAVLDLMAAF